jgi:hypothetical protein
MFEMSKDAPVAVSPYHFCITVNTFCVGAVGYHEPAVPSSADNKNALVGAAGVLASAVPDAKLVLPSAVPVDTPVENAAYHVAVMPENSVLTSSKIG